MNFKLILHGLMLTTSALAFLSSPLAFSDDTITLKKEKGHDYTRDDKRLLDVPEYVKATGKSKDAFNQAQKGEINSHRDFYKEKLSDDTVSMKHIDDALEVVTSVKRGGHQSTPKEFSGAHWGLMRNFALNSWDSKKERLLPAIKSKLAFLLMQPPLARKK